MQLLDAAVVVKHLYDNPMTEIKFDNTYAQLPSHMFTRQSPAAVSSPKLIRVNHDLCRLLAIDPQWLESPMGVGVLAGNTIPVGADPIATAYAGHQFGHWNPQLGDGRALLLGEVVGKDSQRYDIQLKGSGPTPYSRRGDGRAPLGPVLREYIVSEAMAALNVKTSRALAAVLTGEPVVREEVLPGAVFTRVAQSHIRIGTFQFFASRGDQQALDALCNHVIDRHYPEARDAENPVLAMLQAVILAQAKLVSSWQLLGFIHGVMNTDNVLLSGETIDYGPCAFMDDYNPSQVFSSIDQQGRYAYNNQPSIAHWNLACLAQSLLTTLDPNQDRAIELAQEAINSFPDKYDHEFKQGMKKKLGLVGELDSDAQLSADLFGLMAETRSDFTQTFARLTKLASGEDNSLDDRFGDWLSKWQSRLAENPDAGSAPSLMQKANPVYIPRNHLVEAAINAAYQDNFKPFHQLVEVIADPWTERPGLGEYGVPPKASEVVRQTFCGT